MYEAAGAGQRCPAGHLRLSSRDANYQEASRASRAAGIVPQRSDLMVEARAGWERERSGMISSWVRLAGRWPPGGAAATTRCAGCDWPGARPPLSCRDAAASVADVRWYDQAAPGARGRLR